MEEFLHQYGSLGIVLFLVLTGCGLPIPEEVALIAAGVLAAKEILDPWVALAACLIGCLLGDTVMYWIGRRLGRRLLRPGSWGSKYLTPEREKTLEHLIHRHGVKVLFASRFLVGVRSPVYLTAGILKFPFRRFIIADLFCAAIVILLFFGLSYFFGEWAGALIHNAEYGLTIVVAILALVGAVFAWIYFHRSKRPHNPGALGKLLGENEQSVEAGLEESATAGTAAAEWNGETTVKVQETIVDERAKSSAERERL